MCRHVRYGWEIHHNPFSLLAPMAPRPVYPSPSSDEASVHWKGSDLVNTSSETLLPISDDADQLLTDVETLGVRLPLVRERIGRVIFGQREVVDQALITLLAGG